MNDNKKFWLITIIYLLLFWIFPLLFVDKLFIFLDNILRQVGIMTAGIDLYLLIFIPLVLVLIYTLFLHKINIRFKKTLFTLLYIVLPYASIVLIFFYSIFMAFSNPGFLSL